MTPSTFTASSSFENPCLRRVCAPLLKVGHRVRVTHVEDMASFQGGPADYRAGEVVQGVITFVESDGFFQLNTDCGEVRGYFMYDPTLRLQALDSDR